MSGGRTTDLADPAIVGWHIGSLRADRDRLAALAGADLDAPVVHCPGWALRDLIDHTGQIHRWAREFVALPPDADRPQLGRGAGERDPVEWLVEGLDALIERFTSIDLTAPCGTFTEPSIRAWWLRRQAMETAVHRWDAQTAANTTATPVDPDVAESGIDEWCEIESGRWFRTRPDLTLTVHLHATDDGVGDGEWFVEVTPEGMSWEHGHRKGDVAVRGSRSDLFLLAWRRVDPSALEVLGGADQLERFLTATAVE